MWQGLFWGGGEKHGLVMASYSKHFVPNARCTSVLVIP